MLYLDLLLTALAPIIWGTTYYVTTELLPEGYPITAAMLRALPAGLLLMLWVRQLPQGVWWGRLFILGICNFSIFWIMLFIAAYRLPGGVAATVGAIQPMVVMILAYYCLQQTIRPLSLIASLMGVVGVGLLVLSASAVLDMWGVLAGLCGAISMAFGTVLTRKWQPQVPLLTLTTWQLMAGGIVLLPIALWFEPPLPTLTHEHISGFMWLGIAGAVLSYFLWFRGIRRLPVATVSIFMLLSPLTAVLIDWLVLGEQLNSWQLGGMLIVLSSIVVVSVNK